MANFNTINVRNNAIIGGAIVGNSLDLRGNALIDGNAEFRTIIVREGSTFLTPINAPGGIKINDYFQITPGLDKLTINDGTKDFMNIEKDGISFGYIKKLQGNIFYDVEIFNGKVNTGNGVLYKHDTLGTWTSDSPNFSPSLDSSIVKDTNNSLKITCNGLANANEECYDVRANENWEDRDRIGFWIYSDLDLSATDINFFLYNDTLIYQYPMSLSTGWQYKVFDISTQPRTNIAKIGFLVTATGATKTFNLYLGKIIHYNSNNSVLLSKQPIYGLIKPPIYISLLSTDNHIATGLTENVDFLITYDGDKRFVPLIDLSKALIFMNFSYEE